MNILDAENCFKKGLAAMVDGHLDRAAALFKSAMQIERQRGARRPQMRYLSYYGLSMARAHGVTPAAIDACETAARRDFFNPDLQLNLGRVFLLAGKTTRALMAFERGLRLSPRHPALRAELARVDRRKRPAISALPRGHRINQWLGRLRASLGSAPERRAVSRRRAPAA